MIDRELIELAAKAAGIRLEWEGHPDEWEPMYCGDYPYYIYHAWNPLTDDGDALRLAVKLNLSADFFDDEILVGYTPNQNDCDQVKESVGDDPYAATRRAIVRAAAEIGRNMK